MRFAYADPPYPGKARKYYGAHPDFAGEVDHAALIAAGACVSAPSTRGPFGTARPISLAALDAAIAETTGRPPRRDRLERDDRVFRWVCRRAIAEGSLRFNTTYAEAAAGAGYAVPRLNCRGNRRRAREQRASTVWRALSSLQAAGLVRFHGVKRTDGRWRCLSVALTPAAYAIAPAFGRSRRGPKRCPGGRISFTRRSGTSPAVATAKNGSEDVSLRARARDHPPEGAGEEGGGFLESALAAHRAPPRPSGPRPWPHEHFDLRVDERIVILVELFEAEFGIPARWSYRDHDRNRQLLRILERFDRHTGADGDRWGWRADGRRRRPGAGLRHACGLIARWGRLRRAGNLRAAKPQSLAYFLPKLEQQSKKRRRTWRARYAGARVWGPTEESR